MKFIIIETVEYIHHIEAKDEAHARKLIPQLDRSIATSDKAKTWEIREEEA